MPSHRNKIDIALPSTSHDHKVCSDTEQCLSSSPTVRIAKRNAQLLNEIDLISGKKKAAFAESIMNIVPDLELSELDEKCSVIQRILNTNTISAEDLNTLQQQVEELIMMNTDNQKRLHGELTYLKTGDYPTIDLSTRPMPVYELARRSPSSAKKRQNVDENLSDLGLNSSHEEDDQSATAITNISQRFWNWSREYLRHITDSYVTDFKSKIVDRFSDEALQQYFLNEIDKSINCDNNDGETLVVEPPQPQKVDGKSRRRSSRTSEDGASGKCARVDSSTLRNGRNSDQMTPSKPNVHDGPSATKRGRIGRRSSNVDGIASDERILEDVAECEEPSASTSSVTNAPNNGVSGALKRSDSVSAPDGNIMHSLWELGAAVASSIGSGKKDIAFDLSPKYFSSSIDDTDDCKPSYSGTTKTENNLGGGGGSENELLGELDEVSRDLKLKQRELLQIADVSRPIINQLFERIQAEYALYETSRRLDLADDKLFELGMKYDFVLSLTKEQRAECELAVASRQRMARKYYPSAAFGVTAVTSVATTSKSSAQQQQKRSVKRSSRQSYQQKLAAKRASFSDANGGSNGGDKASNGLASAKKTNSSSMEVNAEADKEEAANHDGGTFSDHASGCTNGAMATKMNGCGGGKAAETCDYK